MRDAAADHPVAVAPRHSIACREPASSASAHWLVIANPVAGRAGRDSRAWRNVEQALRAAQVSFDVAWTRERGDGARIAAEAWCAGSNRFLVAGGDGSLHDVVNGLLRERRADDEGAHVDAPTVVPLPLGTGNDWSRTLALPRNPAALAAIIRRDESVLHDVGRIDFLSTTGATRDACWFINVAGAGFDAHVIERMPARTPSRLAYLFGALRELVRYRSPAFRLMLDGAGADDVATGAGIEMQGRWLLTFVANGRYCGGGMHVAPDAQPDDGRFDILTIEALGLFRALPRLARLYSGTLLQDSVVQLRRASRVTIEADPAAGIEADGQFVGHTPAVFSLERGALRTLRGNDGTPAALAAARAC